MSTKQFHRKTDAYPKRVVSLILCHSQYCKWIQFKSLRLRKATGKLNNFSVACRFGWSCIGFIKYSHLLQYNNPLPLKPNILFLLACPKKNQIKVNQENWFDEVWRISSSPFFSLASYNHWWLFIYSRPTLDHIFKPFTNKTSKNTLTPCWSDLILTLPFGKKNSIGRRKMEIRKSESNTDESMVFTIQ